MARGEIPKSHRLTLLRVLLRERGDLQSSEYKAMASQLRISTSQIRRDLKELEEAGVVRCRHGYTEYVPTAERVVVKAIDPRSGFGEALEHHWEEKLAVAERLVALLPVVGDDSEQTLYVGAGTTMSAFALALARSHRRIHVYTGSLPAVLVATQAPNLTVSVIGGGANKLSLRTEGEEYERLIGHGFDVGAFSCMVMSTEGMFSDIVHDPTLRQRLMSSCRRVLVGIVGSKLAEHSSGQLITSFERLAKQVDWACVVTTPPRSAEGKRVLGSLQQKLKKSFPQVSNPLVIVGA